MACTPFRGRDGGSDLGSVLGLSAAMRLARGSRSLLHYTCGVCSASCLQRERTISQAAIAKVCMFPASVNFWSCIAHRAYKRKATLCHKMTTAPLLFYLEGVPTCRGYLKFPTNGSMKSGGNELNLAVLRGAYFAFSKILMIGNLTTCLIFSG